MAQRPNVLIVFSDQESHHDLLPGVSAPHQDRLAARGTVFAQSYCTTPQCSPARGSILTGLYPHQTGVQTNLDAAHARELPPGTLTLGGRARAAGYRTAYFGKWHLSQRPGAEAFGFDVPGHPSGHGDRAVAEQAAAWLQGQGEEPWLAMVSFVNPHDIYNFPRRSDYPVRPEVAPPPSLGDDLAAKPSAQARFLHEDQGRPLVGADEERWRQYRSMYYDLVGEVDGHLGRLLDVLDGRGTARETCVVYTSDHGDLAGAHGLPFKGPCMYEELVRVPLIVRWPGVVPAGNVAAGLVSHLDLVPTLCAAMGGAAPSGLPGRNLLDLLAGRAWREELFFEYLAKQRWVCPIRTIRSGPWKMNVYLQGGIELYHLGEDPHEMINLAGSEAHRTVVDELTARLARWREETGDSLPREHTASVDAAGTARVQS